MNLVESLSNPNLSANISYPNKQAKVNRTPKQTKVQKLVIIFTALYLAACQTRLSFESVKPLFDNHLSSEDADAAGMLNNFAIFAKPSRGVSKESYEFKHLEILRPRVI